MNSPSVLSGPPVRCSQATHSCSSASIAQLHSRLAAPSAQQSARFAPGRSNPRCAATGNGAESPAEPNRHSDKHSLHRNGRHRHRDDALPISLYTRYEQLPCDGRSQHIEEEICDPKQQNCRTPVHVWESKCVMCSGTGFVTSYSRGGRGRGARRSSGSCPGCHGLGCVRKTSSRIVPDVNGGNGQFTVGRPPCEITWSEEDKQKSLFDRFKEKLGSGGSGNGNR